jgi:hypothetical protein
MSQFEWGRDTALSALQTLMLVLAFICYPMASLHECLAMRSPGASRSVKPNLRVVQLGLTIIAGSLTASKAILDLRFTGFNPTGDPDVISALFMTLAWVVLGLGLLTTPCHASYSHRITWMILLLSHGVDFGRTIAAWSSGQLRQWPYGATLACVVVQGFQLFIVGALLVLTTIWTLRSNRKCDDSDDEGTRPLLHEGLSEDQHNQHEETDATDASETRRSESA